MELASIAPQGAGLALLAAVLLGLRHATDPDHLTAVSTLVLGDHRRGTHRAAALGLAWGAGHAATLFLCGLPVLLFGRALPEPVTRVAELSIGVLIAGLAVRLYLRWRRGSFHSHPHAHQQILHAHPHVHELRSPADHGPAHGHAHAESLGRSPLAAFGIGLLHGAGGSAAVGVLLLGAMSGRAHGVLALALFAAATALSMALVSAGFGWAVTRGTMTLRLERCVPFFAAAGAAFGVWFAAAAVGIW